MNATVNGRELKKALRRADRIWRPRDRARIANTLALEASGEELTLRVTDPDIGVVARIPARVASEGSVTVPTRELAAFLEGGEGGQVDLVAEGQAVEVSEGERRCELPAGGPEEFPKLPAGDGIEFGPIDARLLARMIDGVFFAAPEDDFRPALEGVFMEQGDEGRLRFVATDGRRLAFAERRVMPPLAFPVGGIIVPRDGVRVLRAFLAGLRDTVEIGVSERTLYARGPTWEILCRLIDCKFPDYKQVIPQSFRFEASVTRKPLIDALRRQLPITDQGIWRSLFVLKSGKLTLRPDQPDVDAEETLPVEYTGKRFEVAFNPRYVLEALSALRSETVAWRFVDAKSCATLVPVGDPDQLILIMPMRN